MRVSRAITIVWFFWIAMLVCLPRYADAQPARAASTIYERLNADVPREIERLEALRAKTPATAPWPEKSQTIAAPLFFYYLFFARVASADDLAEIDSRAASLHAWWSVGAPDAIDMQVVWIEYYLNSSRPGIALRIADAAQNQVGATRTQIVALKLYQAQAYAELGRMPEASTILSQFVSFADIPAEDYDGIVSVFSTVSLRVWSAMRSQYNVQYAWRVAERLFQRGVLEDLQFWQLAMAGYSAAIQTGDSALAAKAQTAINRYRKTAFGGSSPPRDPACAALNFDDIDALAKTANLGVQFFACTRSASGVRLPSDLLMRGARALELQKNHAQAGAAFILAVDEAEQARNSFDITQRQTFFEGLHRLNIEGAVQNFGLAAQLNPSDTASFFAGLAAGDRMRARQLGDMRGLDELATPAALETFARALPDGVMVVAISTLERARVAFTFTNSERRVGMMTNLPQGIDALWGDTVVRFLRDPSEDFDQVTSLYLRTAPWAVLGDGATLLKRARRVIVLADGAMARVPAATWSIDPFQYTPLGDTAQIVYAPSLRDLLAKPRPVSRARGLFALGNPTMPTIPAPLGLSLEQANVLSPTAGATRDRSGALGLARLDNAEFEVRDLARFISPNSLMFDAAASERAVKTANLAQWRYLHFATHGLLAGDFAGLAESALVLAPGEGEDGFLLGSEIEALKLDADLTVLSACNTGSGRAVTGEGVIGLSRAFLVAGSRSVLASLWPVDDATTELFMTDFYERLRSGTPAATALKETASAIRAQNPHPKFWAPFILVQAG